MGGVAKGQIIREIDALGGLSGQVTDASMIQFRMLNRSKGPAVWSPRSQNDRLLFTNIWRLKLEANPNISFWQEMVESLIVKDNIVRGVRTSLGLEFWGEDGRPDKWNFFEWHYSYRQETIRGRADGRTVGKRLNRTVN